MGFWRAEFSETDIKQLLDQLRRHRRFDKDGHVKVVSPLDFDGHLAILLSASGFDARTDALRKRVLNDTVFSSELAVDFKEADFRAVAYRVRARLQAELKAYRVAFAVWNCPKFLTGIRSIEDVRINFSPRKEGAVYRRIARERSLQRSRDEFSYFFTSEKKADIEKCTLAIASVRAGSPADANERASEAIYEVLGLANMACDLRKLSRRSFMVPLPVSETLLAPQTTVHHADGTLALGGFWHEQWVGGPREAALEDKVLVERSRNFDLLSRGVAKSPWRSDCRRAAVRYFKAFSNPNLEESFLEGWRLFELISGTSKDDGIKKVRRASNVFLDNLGYEASGKHLWLRRNYITHGNSIKANDAEVLTFQMLNFVLPFLVRYIRNVIQAKSVREFWEFLDLPRDPGAREAARARLLREGIRVRRQLSLLERARQLYGDGQIAAASSSG